MQVEFEVFISRAGKQIQNRKQVTFRQSANKSNSDNLKYGEQIQDVIKQNKILSAKSGGITPNTSSHQTQKHKGLNTQTKET